MEKRNKESLHKGWLRSPQALEKGRDIVSRAYRTQTLYLENAK